MTRSWLLLSALGAFGLLLSALPGCGNSDTGRSTGAVCDNTLTYTANIKPIMDMYCIRCHAAALQGSARMGAPLDHNFDTEAGILKDVAHIDEEAGSGPNRTNTSMPPSDPRPGMAERATLSKYLACRR